MIWMVCVGLCQEQSRKCTNKKNCLPYLIDYCDISLSGVLRVVIPKACENFWKPSNTELCLAQLSLWAILDCNRVVLLSQSWNNNRLRAFYTWNVSHTVLFFHRGNNQKINHSEWDRGWRVREAKLESFGLQSNRVTVLILWRLALSWPRRRTFWV